MTRRRFTAWLAIGATALAAFADSDGSRGSITLGTIEMAAGTTWANWIDGAALQAYPAISGTLHNQSGAPLRAIEVSVRRIGATGTAPRFTSVSTPGTELASATPSKDTADGAGQFATVTLASPLPPNGCVVFLIDGVSCGESDVLCRFTAVTGSQGLTPPDATLLPRFAFTSAVSSLTQAGECSHDRIVFELKNDDRNHPVIGWTGTVTFLDDPARKIGYLLHQDVRSEHAHVQNNRVSIEGNAFTIDGFTPLDDGGLYELMIAFDAASSAGRIQVQISPTYEH